MVESFRELNQLCQKPDYKTKGNWYVRAVLREAALPATWLLLHTPVTANQVTLISLLAALLGMFFLAVPGEAAFLTGALLLQFWYYLDHVDGQIARYRKTASLTGRFLDFLTHHIVHATLFFALGFYCYGVTASAAFIVWGFFSALAILAFNSIHDLKYKTFFEKLQQNGGVIRKQRDAFRKASKGTAPLAKRFFSFAHKCCEIHVMMNILTLGALIQLVFSTIDPRFFLFWVYGLVAPGIAVAKIAYILKVRKIDVDYQAVIDEKIS